MDEAKIRKLIADHAYWSDRKRELKRLGEAEMALCENLEEYQLGAQVFTSGKTCIEEIWNEFMADERMGDEDPPDFEEIWKDMVVEGDVCGHCQRVRSLKAERVKASRRLGQIRGAITRVGRKFQEEA